MAPSPNDDSRGSEPSWSWPVCSAAAPPRWVGVPACARTRPRTSRSKPDLASAYTFLSPASRATMSLDWYKAKHNVGMYRAVTIEDVNCEADRCTVNLRLTYDYQRFKGMITPLVERWIITQGQ